MPMTGSLPSWNAGAAKTAILDFVDRVTQEGGSDFAAPGDRVAVIDNDGTLWCERPAYAQALFLLGRLREQAAADPELAAQPVVKALLAGDLEGAVGYGLEAVAGILLNTHAGLSTEEFADTAAQWLAEAKHPRFGVRFGELAYLPMLELLDFLRAREFRVFVVTGGGVEFVRAVSDRLYGVAPDDVVGSAVQVSFERRDGRVVLVRQPALLGSPNEGPPKAVNIQSHIGRRPILAAGNSAGDREMLEYAHTGNRPSLCLVIDHDDPRREYAYAGASATDPDAEPILDSASRFGWTVVSMREDWNRVFAQDGGS
jgi:phosphoserine phosphatase